ncbi:MAG: hypothetical protein KGI54_05920 [Pseudomonadota bacterium]|nr:hypothetical protein [Pseudomonadota bacterium]
MLSDFDVSEALRRLSEVLPGFRQRNEQVQMMDIVSQTFGSDNQAFAMIEAGTGTGKTFSYLLPGIIASKRTGKRLVISTATVALQDQLIAKDLPTLAKVFPGLKYAVAKGKNRYACLMKLDHQASGIQTDIFAAETETPSVHASLLYGLIRDDLWDGGRDTLAVPVQDSEWKKVSVDSATCMGRGCRHFNECPYIAARSEFDKSDVIVANHDVLMFAYQNPHSKILPEPENSNIVLDEGHHLPDKVIKTGQLSVMMQKASELIKAAPDIISACIPDQNLAELAMTYAETTYADLRHLRRQIGNLFLSKPKNLIEATSSLVFPFEGIGEILSVSQEGLLGRLNEMNSIAKRAKKTSESHMRDLKNRHADIALIMKAERSYGKVSSLEREIDSIVQGIEAFADEDDEGGTARWVETVPYAGKKDYQTVAAPIDASYVMRGLWKKMHAAVITSATLAPYGDLRQTVRNFGLPKSTATAIIESPFDYGRSRMVIPPMKSDPRNHESHTREVARMLPEYLSFARGSLILFASMRQMKDVFSRLLPEIKKTILVQGNIGKAEILRLHRERIGQGLSSAIFGLASFGEGIDLPGELCELVLIVKLPFDPPGEPYAVAKERWVIDHDGNPFMDLQVPKAAIILKQQTGRLLRHENDTGVVVVLDNRLIATSYGKLMLKGLPFKKYSRKIPDARHTAVA